MEPWLSVLGMGRSQAAWDLFVERYRRVILATIQRVVPDHDDVMDVFSTVCDGLSANDCARLKRYSDRSSHGASVATWLVAVVRNLTIDWLRHHEGRRRVSIPAGLSPLQHAIYIAVCVDGRSHAESYELIRARTGSAMPFHEFLREVRVTHQLAPCIDRLPLRRPDRRVPSAETALPLFDPAEDAELARRIAAALYQQPADVRLAVDLFVVDRMSAADVAQMVGWPNAKTVYNRVYRALTALRAELARDGIGPGDL